MLFERFQQLVKLLSEIRREEAKERLTEIAFIGFQMGAGGDKTFGDYLRHMGLLENKSQEESISKSDLATLKRLVREKK